MFGGIWEELVTKLVHRVLRGVRPSAINTPGSTGIASCALLHGALVAIGWGFGRKMPLTWETVSLYDFLRGFTVEPLNERKTVISHWPQLLQRLHIACVTPFWQLKVTFIKHLFAYDRMSSGCHQCFEYFILNIKHFEAVTHVLCCSRKCTSTQIKRLSELVWSHSKECWQQTSIHSRE